MRALGWLTVLAAVGCRAGFDPTEGEAARPIVVEPFYPEAAGLTDWLEADGTRTPCDGDAIAGGVERGRDACVHAGLVRQAMLPGTSCAGVTATDALGWFTWRCEQRDTELAFVADALAAGVTLRDLVDDTGIRANTLEIREAGRVIASSEPLPWWDNPVVTLAASATLDAARTIYVVPASVTGMSTITAPGVGIVTLADATAGSVNIMLGASYAWVDAHLAPIGSLGVAVNASSFVTIGGEIDRALPAVEINASTACEVNGLRVLNAAGGDGVDIVNSPWTRVYHAAFQSPNYGVYVTSSPDVRLHDVESANATTSGIAIFGASPRAVMTDIVVTNNGFQAIELNDAADDAILVGALAAYSTDEGVMFKGVDRATISHVTSIGQEQFGVSTYLGADYASVSQINAFNNGYYGLFVRGSVYGIYGQIAVTNNNYDGVRVYQNADFNTFIYALLGGPNDLCLVDGGGVDNNSVTSDDNTLDIACGGDDAALSFRATRGLTQDGTLGGEATTDSTNAQAGQAVDASQIVNWLDFANRYRIWGPGASTSFLDGTNRQDCRSPEQCRAWDTRVMPGNPFAGTSGTGRTPNEPFVAGAPCPAAVSGDMTFHNLRGTELAGDGLGDDDGICEPLERCTDPQSVFLVNARELIEDGIGNDNGLCESTEACVYSPNFGYYQGSGDPLAAGACTFVDGSGPFGVTGVTVYAYPDP